MKVFLLLDPTKPLGGITFTASSEWILEWCCLPLLAFDSPISERLYVVPGILILKNVDILGNNSYKKNDYEETGGNGL